MTADPVRNARLIGSTHLRLVQGDLTTVVVDAIVNAANDHLSAFASALEHLA